MELRLGGVGGAFGGMRGDDRVGGLHVALVDQFARKHPAFDPPGVRIDQRATIRRRLHHHRGGIGKLLLLAQVFGLREEIAGRTLRGGHGLQQFGRVLVAPGRRRPGIGQLRGAGQAGDTLRRN